MYKTAFLHVGYDKTGSTALQAASSALHSQLQHLGIQYPQPIVGNNHRFIASAFLNNPAQANFNQATGRSSKSEVEIRREDQCLLSNYEKQIESGWGTLFFSFEGFIWLSKCEHIRLRDWISKFALSIKVLVYVRDPRSYALSAISQRVRTGRTVRVGSHRHHKNIPKLLNVYGRDNVIVREFGRQALEGGDVRHDCYSLIGLESAQIRHLLSHHHDLAALSNQSLSLHAIGVGEALRKQLKGTKLQGAEGAEWRFVQVFGGLLDNIPGPGFSLTVPQELLLFGRPRVRSSCRYLLDEFGIDFRWQAKQFFSASRQTQRTHRSQFNALRKCGIYTKLASHLIDQMSSEIRKAEATSFPSFSNRSVQTGDIT